MESNYGPVHIDAIREVTLEKLHVAAGTVIHIGGMPFYLADETTSLCSSDDLEYGLYPLVPFGIIYTPSDVPA